MSEFNSTRLSATVAHYALRAKGFASTLRETEGAYQALELASPAAATRVEARSYGPGAAFQFLDADPARRQRFIALFDASHPHGLTLPTAVGPVSARLTEDQHDRGFVYGNWSFATAGHRFGPRDGEMKVALRALLIVALVEVLHPLAMQV